MLEDGAYTYLYGIGRIAQAGSEGNAYFLGDALGSVRQLVDGSGTVTLAQSYTPYGEILDRMGEGETRYTFTGEQYDLYSGLIYLRARYYSPLVGRFTSKDPWKGDPYRPASLNAWLYAYANPMYYIDPSGLCSDDDLDGICDQYKSFEEAYGVKFLKGNSGATDWEKHKIETLAVIRGVKKVAQRLSPYARLSPENSFRRIFGGVYFQLNEQPGDSSGYFGYRTSQWISPGVFKIKIELKPNAIIHDPCNNRLIDFKADPWARLVAHELGHAFSARLEDQYHLWLRIHPEMKAPPYNQNINGWNLHPEVLLLNGGIRDENGNFVTGSKDGNVDHYERDGGIPPEDPRYPYLGGTYWTTGKDYGLDEKVRIFTGYQWHSLSMGGGNNPWEDWADIFQNWVFDSSFNTSSSRGLAINGWVNDHMQDWVDMSLLRYRLP